MSLTFRGRPFIVTRLLLVGKRSIAEILYTDNGQRTTLAQRLVDGAKRRRKGTTMNVIAILALLVLFGCGTVEVPSNLASTGTASGTATDTSTSTGTFGGHLGDISGTPTATDTGVEVNVTTTVTVNDGTQTTPAAADPSRVRHFSDGSFGAFLPDGTFDHGFSSELGQVSPESCLYETPDCSGTCFVAHYPEEMSIFGNGSSMWLATSDEIDRGQRVVNSTWVAGACQQSTATIDHSYPQQMGWTPPAGGDDGRGN